MEIASQLLPLLVNLNVAQQQIIAHNEGPLLVIAGPGSGKTWSLILRVLNLPESVAATVRDFGSVVERIQERDFEVRTCPAKHVC